MSNPQTLFQPNPSFSNIKRSITTSFALIFLCGSLLVSGIYLILNQGGYDVKIINITGKQRMLSEKIIKAIYAAQITDTHLSELRKDTEEWHNAHLSLQNGSSPIKPPVLSKDLDSILQEITPYHQQLYNTARRADIADLSDQELQHIDQLGQKYLLGMDTIVTNLEEELSLQLSHFKKAIILLGSSL